MRKMEVTDIAKTYIPKFNQISNDTILALKEIYLNIDFLNLGKPGIRDVDKIWASELFDNRADDILIESQRLLEYLANIRNS